MEFVYVVPRGELFPDFYPQGLAPFGGAQEACSEAAWRARVREAGFFVERDHAERTPELKQVIPYSVVVREGDGGPEVLLLRRTRAGGETRLHDKLSIGVGGHINPEDLEHDRDEIVARGTRRELDEELVLEGPCTIRPIGVINDDSNPVGAVHVGIAQVVTVQGHVGIREEDLLEGSFVTLGELRSLRGEGADFESWSALLIDALDQVVGTPTEARPPRRSASKPGPKEPAATR